MKKIALIGGVVAVAVICAVMFIGGGGSVSIGKKTESPFIAKAAVPSAELQKVIKDKKGYDLMDALKAYTDQNPNDASAWLLYGDTMKAISTINEPYGLRHWAASAYWKGMNLGDPECRKRLLWMVSPASLRSEQQVWEIDPDGVIRSGENHPNYQYEIERVDKALRSIDTSTPEGKKQAEDLKEWGTIVSIISLRDGDIECVPLFYDWLIGGEPTDEDYLTAAYVTIFADYLVTYLGSNILELYEIAPQKFSLNNPKVKEIIDKEIKNQTPVGITIEAMLSKPKNTDTYFMDIKSIRSIISDKVNRMYSGDTEWETDWMRKNREVIRDWIRTAPERVKKLEAVYNQLDTIGMLVLGNEYLNLNMDENFNFTGEYSQKAIDCFKAAQKDPYAINAVTTDIIRRAIIILPDSEITKIVEDISKEGHDYAYSNPEKTWGTVFSKMENVEWKDISAPLYDDLDSFYWSRILLCTGTYQGDKIAIVFPVYYSTADETWYSMDGWIRVFVNKNYEDKMPVFKYIQEHPTLTLLYGEQYGLEGYDRKNPPQPSREVAPWMSEILD